MSQNYFIGVDTSKNKSNLAVLTGDYTLVAEKELKNKPQALESYLKAFCKKHKVTCSEIVVCVEVTGIYNRPLEQACVKLGIGLWTEHALKIKRATTDMRGKSDEIDARRIAEYAVRYQDRAVLHVRLSSTMRRLKDLQKVRETLISQRVALTNQLDESKIFDRELYSVLSKSYKPMVKQIEKQLIKVEENISEIINSEEDLKKNIELATSIPGVGLQLALSLVICTENFKRFRSVKHMACYAGVVPFANESGTMVRRSRISKMANQKLKKLLHLCAMTAVRFNPDLKKYYVRMVAMGKNKMSVINAVRNKLLKIIWAVIQRQTPYQPILSKESKTLDF